MSLKQKVRLRQYPKNLFIPASFTSKAPKGSGGAVSVTAVIPTYKPPKYIISLVERLLSDELVARVVVVDDATPAGWEEVFDAVRAQALTAGFESRLVMVRVEKNQGRAGAINAGLREAGLVPSDDHDILVLDDDVALEKGALNALVRQLHARAQIGAVCTQARVFNRHENFLTRMQGLEYVGFNTARVADRGFLYGPLIMHGLASLIRSRVLMEEAHGYDQSRLLEDYDLTVRIKACGYHVALAEAAVAHTVVPDNWSQLWRQRVRWQYGGLQVVRNHWRTICAVFPDILSHLLTVTLLSSIIFSFVWHQIGNGESPLITVVRTISIALSIVMYVFQLSVTLACDRGRDWVDVLLRALLLPELLYSMILSFVLFGSYAFFIYTEMKSRTKNGGRLGRLVWGVGDYIFALCGFTTTWGTK